MKPAARLLLPALAALALFIGLMGCGDNSAATTATVTSTAAAEATDPSTTSSTSTTAEATEATSTTATEDSSPPAGTEVTELTGFTSPSGNIGCYIDRRTVRCDIAERDWEPPSRPDGCELDPGPGITLDAGSAPAFVCAGDTALGAGDPLPPGQSIAAGLLRCDSEESGMSCRDVETGRGFTISKQGYELR